VNEVFVCNGGGIPLVSGIACGVPAQEMTFRNDVGKKPFMESHNLTKRKYLRDVQLYHLHIRI
jgi:hypothetical protein